MVGRKADRQFRAQLGAAHPPLPPKPPDPFPSPSLAVAGFVNPKQSEQLQVLS